MKEGKEKVRKGEVVAGAVYVLLLALFFPCSKRGYYSFASQRPLCGLFFAGSHVFLSHSSSGSGTSCMFLETGACQV